MKHTSEKMPYYGTDNKYSLDVQNDFYSSYYFLWFESYKYYKLVRFDRFRENIIADNHYVRQIDDLHDYTSS